MEGVAQHLSLPLGLLLEGDGETMWVGGAITMLLRVARCAPDHACVSGGENMHR